MKINSLNKNANSNLKENVTFLFIPIYSLPKTQNPPPPTTEVAAR